MKKVTALILALIICLAAGSALAVNFCPNCGEKVQSGWNNCPYCSYALTELSPEMVTAAKDWEEFHPNPISLKMRSLANHDDRRYTHGGPDGKKYTGTGGYKPYKVNSVKAWFAEDNYVCVEINYQTAKTRIVYILKSQLEGVSNAIPQKHLTGEKAVMKTNYAPCFGPGTEYDVYLEKDAYLYSGTEVLGFFKVNGYVYCEFQANNGKLTRGWVQESCVEKE